MATRHHIVALTLLALTACTSMTEAERFERQAELVEAREDFQQRQKACRNAGGSMQIPGKATKLQRQRYTVQDYRLAYCR